VICNDEDTDGRARVLVHGTPREAKKVYPSRPDSMRKFY